MSDLFLVNVLKDTPVTSTHFLYKNKTIPYDQHVIEIDSSSYELIKKKYPKSICKNDNYSIIIDCPLKININPGLCYLRDRHGLYLQYQPSDVSFGKDKNGYFIKTVNHYLSIKNTKELISAYTNFINGVFKPSIFEFDNSSDSDYLTFIVNSDDCEIYNHIRRTDMHNFIGMIINS